MKRVISTVAKHFVCEKFVEAIKVIIKSSVGLSFYDHMELVKRLC